MELSCKRCSITAFVSMALYLGSSGLNFNATPKRGRSERTKALAVLLYSFGKASFRWLQKLLDVSAVSPYKWVRRAAEALPEPEVREEIREMALDELWHFLHAKKTSVGFGNPMIVTHGVVSPGCWVAVIMLPLGDLWERVARPESPTTPMIASSTMM
jgi:hypothetical protein